MKKRVLVVDDDLMILDAIKQILQDEAYDVVTTGNRETVQKVYDTKPDVILLDIWMSGQDGRDICKHLKRQRTTQYIPIVMISANKDVEKIAKESGADGFITKPFDIDDLITIVNKYTNHGTYLLPSLYEPIRAASRSRKSFKTREDQRP